jgi:pimeloyl-ACP methyl ester carboxylesterase
MRIALSTGISVGYDDAGFDGPPVLLLGGPIPGVVMRAFLGDSFHKAGFRMVTMEYRGVPPSDSPEPPYSVEDLAADAASLIERVGIGPCPVFGYSLGALVAAELMATHPGLVSAAVFAGPRTRPSALYHAIHEENLLRLERSQPLPDRTRTMLRALMMFSPRRLANAVFFDTAMQILDRPPDESTGYNELGLASASAHYDVKLDTLRAIAVPSLVVAFELDVLTPPYQAGEWVAAIPGARYVEMPNAGHGAFMERPRELVRLVTDFFGSLALGTGAAG